MPPKGFPMFVRRMLAVVAAAPLAGFALAAPAAAQTPLAAEDGGSGRTGATVALAITLAGVAVGAWALRSAKGGGNRRIGALAAVVLAMIGLVAGGLALVGSDGGVGTGNGRGGAIVAVVLALIGLVVGGLALARSRRTV